MTRIIVIGAGVIGCSVARELSAFDAEISVFEKGNDVAVGTSKALQMGEIEGAMSGLSIAVAGVLTAVLCPLFVGLIH